jgi:hypothetical protein
MTADERRTFAGEVAGLLREGMEQAGVPLAADGSLGELDARIAGLGGERPPPDELLIMGLLDGVPIGRLWATLHTGPDGELDFVGNMVELFPEFRGRRLTPSFLGALRRELHTLGVTAVRGRLYAQAAGARRMVVGEGARIDDVHLRKELT